MTRFQYAFLMLLAGATMFIVGAMIITEYNLGRSTETWGFIGGLCWIFGPCLFLCGLIMAVLEALRRPQSN